jgi:signal transduction histidine kinase
VTRRRSFDVALAAVLGAAAQAEAWLGPYEGRPLLSALCLAQVLPLVVRRRTPLAACLATVGLFALGQAVTGDLTEMASGTLPLLVAAYTLGAYLPLRRAVPAGAAAVAAALLSVVPDPSPSSFAYAALVVSVAWGVGRVVAARHSQVDDLSAQAEQLRRQQAEAVASERARIARELHDVVAHGVSVMVVQAGAAEGVLRSDPDAAAAALGDIRSTGQQALVELRRMLDLLRSEEADDGGLAPQPGLADVERLVASARSAGLDVTLEVDDDAPQLPPALSLTAYRVVQESLTNALKHAGPAPVHVRVARSGPGVEVAVTDGGRGASSTVGTGHGLIGMRERVALFGGTLDVRTAPGQGFAVRALLPAPAVP